MGNWQVDKVNTLHGICVRCNVSEDYGDTRNYIFHDIHILDNSVKGYKV